ncbi:hypothetical protein [Spirosoma foliorum]|nr:hypothetical protein [Spirosoma foliorum]
MMRLVLLFVFCLFLVLPGQAQERVRNVRIHVVDSSQLEIRYDLIVARPGDSLYFEVQSRLRGNLHILPEFVRGDIGIRITAGSDRRIIWDALANGYSLNEEIQAKVLVRASVPLVASRPATAERSTQVTHPKPSIFASDSVNKEPAKVAPVATTPPVATTSPTPTQPPASVAVSTPNLQPPVSQTVPAVQSVSEAPLAVVTDSVRRPKTRYAGPAWALLSAVAPGIGNIFVQMPKPKVGFRPLLTIGCYGLIAYGLSERTKAQDAYAVYEEQKNSTAGEPYYQTANDHHHRYFMATRGAVVVAAADVILTFIKGLRNSQIQKEAKRFQGVRLRPGLQAGQMTAVVRYSF